MLCWPTPCPLGMCYSKGKHYTCLLWCHILPVCTLACTLVHDVGQRSLLSETNTPSSVQGWHVYIGAVSLGWLWLTALSFVSSCRRCMCVSFMLCVSQATKWLDLITKSHFKYVVSLPFCTTKCIWLNIMWLISCPVQLSIHWFTIRASVKSRLGLQRVLGTWFTGA